MWNVMIWFKWPALTMLEWHDPWQWLSASVTDWPQIESWDPCRGSEDIRSAQSRHWPGPRLSTSSSQRKWSFVRCTIQWIFSILIEEEFTSKFLHSWKNYKAFFILWQFIFIHWLRFLQSGEMVRWWDGEMVCFQAESNYLIMLKSY